MIAPTVEAAAARINMALAEAGHPDVFPSMDWPCPVGVEGCRCDAVGLPYLISDDLMWKAIRCAGLQVPCRECWGGPDKVDHHDCFNGRCPRGNR